MEKPPDRSTTRDGQAWRPLPAPRTIAVLLTALALCACGSAPTTASQPAVPAATRTATPTVIQCQDGMFSKSGGIQGSCSYHHGNLHQLFSP